MATQTSTNDAGTSTPKLPVWFWVVSGIALVWNLLGVGAYLRQVFMSAETLATYSEAEQALMTDIPAWATGAFALGVWGGALGCILLLLKNKLAYPVLIVSLAGIIVQMIYNLFISNSIEVYGPGGAVMPIMILLVAAGLIWFSRRAINNGWIR